MALKTRVKVGNITNLSDARYCAGMGVDMLGYTVVPDREGFIPAKLYQEIRGWISGPSTVAELYGMTSATDLDAVMEEYRPDYLEIPASALPLVGNTQGPSLIVAVDSVDDVKAIDQWKERIAFVQVNDTAIIPSLPDKMDVLLFLNPGTPIEMISYAPPIQGIALTGSDEIRPGYKDYDELARVLEGLEC